MLEMLWEIIKAVNGLARWIYALFVLFALLIPMGFNAFHNTSRFVYDKPWMWIFWLVTGIWWFYPYITLAFKELRNLKWSA